jgi:hypothetical protein
MATTHEQPTGFGGLDEFVTQIEAALGKADKLSTVAVESPEAQEDFHADAPVHRDWGALAGLGRGLVSIIGIGISIVVVVAIKACAYAAFSTASSSSAGGQTDYSSSTAYTPATPSSSDDGSATSDTSTPADQSSYSSAGATTDPTEVEGGASGADAYTTTESAPSPSELGGRYSAAEVRYCLSQEIRVSGAQSYMNDLKFTDSSQFNDKVDQFNGMVSDWNSRCARFSYGRETMTSIQADVEAHRQALEMEGRSGLQ